MAGMPEFSRSPSPNTIRRSLNRTRVSTISQEGGRKGERKRLGTLAGSLESRIPSELRYTRHGNRGVVTRARLGDLNTHSVRVDTVELDTEDTVRPLMVYWRI